VKPNGLQRPLGTGLVTLRPLSKGRFGTQQMLPASSVSGQDGPKTAEAAALSTQGAVTAVEMGDGWTQVAFPEAGTCNPAAQIRLTTVEMVDGWTQVELPAVEMVDGWTQVGLPAMEMCDGWTQVELPAVGMVDGWTQVAFPARRERVRAS